MTTFNQDLKEYQELMWDTTNRKELEEDHGIQFKTIKGQKTLATFYYYQSQATTMQEFKQLQNWMSVNGFELTVGNRVDFEGQSWPKTSWARVTYTVEKL